MQAIKSNFNEEGTWVSSKQKRRKATVTVVWGPNDELFANESETRVLLLEKSGKKDKVKLSLSLEIERTLTRATAGSSRERSFSGRSSKDSGESDA